MAHVSRSVAVSFAAVFCALCDVRQVSGEPAYSGLHIVAGQSSSSTSYGVEIYGEQVFDDRTSSMYAGIMVLVDETLDERRNAELEVGYRLSCPWDVAPYIGIGATLGSITTWENDDTNDTDFFLAVSPEIGVQVYLSEMVRIDGVVRYYLSADARSDNMWLFGFGVSRRL